MGKKKYIYKYCWDKFTSYHGKKLFSIEHLSELEKKIKLRIVVKNPVNNLIKYLIYFSTQL